MKWFLFLIPAIGIEFLAWIFTPIVCLFVVRRDYTDRVKRLGNMRLTMQREFLPSWLNYFSTHDNAVDEFFWGSFKSRWIDATVPEYASSWWTRYVYRCLWLFRNTAYGFHYAWFSVPVEPEDVVEHGDKSGYLWFRYRKRKSSWQLQYQIPIPLSNRYIDGNIGFKGHAGFPRLMIANRILGIRTRGA